MEGSRLRQSLEELGLDKEGSKGEKWGQERGEAETDCTTIWEGVNVPLLNYDWRGRETKTLNQSWVEEETDQLRSPRDGIEKFWEEKLEGHMGTRDHGWAGQGDSEGAEGEL